MADRRARRMSAPCGRGCRRRLWTVPAVRDDSAGARATVSALRDARGRVNVPARLVRRFVPAAQTLRLLLRSQPAATCQAPPPAPPFTSLGRLGARSFAARLAAGLPFLLVFFAFMYGLLQQHGRGFVDRVDKRKILKRRLTALRIGALLRWQVLYRALGGCFALALLRLHDVPSWDPRWR